MLRSEHGASAPIIAFLWLALWPNSGRAQPAPTAVELPAIVVTADRTPEPIARSGSAISVVTREQIDTFSSTSLVDVLRSVPGLDITENGGPGATTVVRLRGANTGQTLVLIDGIRVNDPSSASGEFDFSTLMPTAIDRIEVLRGPQSALYGSDAIGGVVNILTRTGGGTPRFEARTEAGSYGTLNSSATASGALGPWSFAFSGGGQKSAGFSRYGYRIGRLESRFPRFEADGFDRYGGYGRLGYDAGEGVKLEIGILSVKTHAQYDAASGAFPDTPANTDRQFTQVFARGTAEQGPLTHSLKVYVNETDRSFRDYSYRTNVLPQNTTGTGTEFRGDRIGTEYQGDLRAGPAGTVTFGGRFEGEKGTTFSTPLLPAAGIRRRTLDGEQNTRSLFALWQVPIGERLILSLGGRHDEVNDVTFNTWRATAAYLIPETGTKLRASRGTGGKAPTLFQLFAPTFGNPDLTPERSIGWDAGIDQTLFDGRLTLSATVFGNRFSNLIDFNAATSSYFNVSRAESSGVEIEGVAILWPDFARLTGAYTCLHAKDLATNLTLARRPEHVGRIGLALNPLPNWLVEPRVTLVSERFSGNGETSRLAPYARFDIYSEYKIDQTWRVFVRAENLNNAHYEEILNYGTTGRAVYAGFNVTW